MENVTTMRGGKPRTAHVYSPSKGRAYAIHHDGRGNYFQKDGQLGFRNINVVKNIFDRPLSPKMQRVGESSLLQSSAEDSIIRMKIPLEKRKRRQMSGKKSKRNEHSGRRKSPGSGRKKKRKSR